MAITDYRLNPFTGALNLKSISGEVHTIPSNSPYEIRLNEVPYKGSPSTLKISFQSGGSLTEVSAQPAAGQFWPDYSATASGIDGWNTGRVLFNATDAGKTVVCSYQGMGTLADGRLAEQLELTFSGSTQTQLKLNDYSKMTGTSSGTDSTEGGGREDDRPGSRSTSRYNTNPGIAAGTYTLLEVLKKLVEMSHTHERRTYTINYDCNCNDPSAGA